MAASDLQLVAGTTFAFTAQWGSNDGGEFVPVDVSGGRARFVMRDLDNGDLVAECTTEDGGIDFSDPTQGVIDVRLAPDKTRGQKARSLGSVAWELRVFMSSGDEYSLGRGFVAIVEGVM